MLFGSAVLEIVLGLAFLYFFISLTITVLNEFAASLFAFRANTLKDGIRALLNGDEDLRAELYEHPLIKVLYQNNRGPSYIAPSTFAQALLDSVASAKEVEAGLKIAKALRLEKLDDKWPAAIKIIRDLSNRLTVLEGYTPADNVQGELDRLIEALDNDSTSEALNAIESAMDDLRPTLKHATRLTPLPEMRAAYGMLVALRPVLQEIIDPNSLPNSALDMIEHIIRSKNDDGMLPDALERSLLQLVSSARQSLGDINSETIANAVKLAESAGREAFALTMATGETGDVLANVYDKVKQTSTGLAMLQKKVEEWFDHTMDRTTGWYKRRAQIVTIFFAVIVVLLINGDTLTMVQELNTNAALRVSLAGSAQVVAEAGFDAENPEEALGDIQEEIEAIDYPLGWQYGDLPTNSSEWLQKIIGLAATILAVSLGAPFWFDIISKLARVRITGAQIQSQRQQEASSGS